MQLNRKTPSKFVIYNYGATRPTSNTSNIIEPRAKQRSRTCNPPHNGVAEDAVVAFPFRGEQQKASTIHGTRADVVCHRASLSLSSHERPVLFH